LALGYQSASAQLVTESFGTGVNAFTMVFVSVGNPGNPVDPYGSGWNNGRSPGSVSYEFSIGKYEIRRSDIEGANVEGNLGITLYDTTYAGWSGINKPATGIAWREAAKFVNYLNQSKGFDLAYKFIGDGPNQTLSTWVVGDLGYNQANPFRNQNSKYFLPSIDEWHKAAYYNPANSTYSTYPNGSNQAPLPITTGSEGSVYGQSVTNQVGPADVDNAGSLSFYGTMAQGGNALELMETAYDLVNDDPAEVRWFGGGSWVDDVSLAFLQSNSFGASYNNPDSEWFHMGFRVASVPEPSTYLLSIFGVLLVTITRPRRT